VTIFPLITKKTLIFEEKEEELEEEVVLFSFLILGSFENDVSPS
jgi:hypothetical protein